MPAGDRVLELGGLCAQPAKMPEARHQLGPLVGHQREEKPRAGRRPQLPGGAQQVFEADIVLLEIDSTVAIYLQIDEGRNEPEVAGGWFARGLQRNDPAPLPAQADRLAGGGGARAEFTFLHERAFCSTVFRAAVRGR